MHQTQRRHDGSSKPVARTRKKRSPLNKSLGLTMWRLPMRVLLTCVLFVVAAGTAVAAETCQRLNARASGPEANYRPSLEASVIGKGKAFLHSAPLAKCANTTALAPGTFVTVYKPHKQWLEVMYLDKDGQEHTGWLRKERLRLIGPYGIKERSDSSSTITSRAEDSRSFEASWEQCDRWQGDTICSGYVLKQRGSRVCGTWAYWASNKMYEGRIVATAAGRVADWNAVCGRPGSRASSECPDLEDAQGRFLICDGRLYEFDGRQGPTNQTCSAVKQRSRMKKTQKPVQMKLAPDDSAWINECLAADNPVLQR